MSNRKDGSMLILARAFGHPGFVPSPVGFAVLDRLQSSKASSVCARVRLRRLR